MQFKLITIVGVGLIGGSIGLAAKRRGVVRRVRGLGRQQASLDRALQLGAIDETHLDPGAALAGADLVVFCTPVDQIAAQVVEFAKFCSPTTLLTDAGSTKATIVSQLDGRLPSGGPVFVGSHPLAGSEKRGPSYADADLFQNRWTVVTPTQRTPPDALAKVIDFWSALGSRVKILSPTDHDRALAFTSHLPHLVAAALASALPPQLHDLTASGFKDTTRIAAGDPGLWTAIFAQNREPLLEAIRGFDERFRAFREAVEQCDVAAVHRLLSQAKEVRDALGS